jgi:hypothetical protein
MFSTALGESKCFWGIKIEYGGICEYIWALGKRIWTPAGWQNDPTGAAPRSFPRGGSISQPAWVGRPFDPRGLLDFSAHVGGLVDFSTHVGFCRLGFPKHGSCILTPSVYCLVP